jgi:hypothetical protein
MTEEADLRAFNPLGAYLRTAYLPYRWGDNKLGFEFALYILDHPNRMSYDEWRYVDLLRYVQLGIVYQRKFYDWQLNARLGAGVSNPYEYTDDDPTNHHDDDGVSIPPAMNFGLSVQRFIKNGFYVEAGLDMVISFGYDTHRMLNPGIGVGWQFNRDAETGLRLK